MVPLHIRFYISKAKERNAFPTETRSHRNGRSCMHICNDTNSLPGQNPRPKSDGLKNFIIRCISKSVKTPGTWGYTCSDMFKQATVIIA